MINSPVKNTESLLQQSNSNLSMLLKTANQIKAIDAVVKSHLDSPLSEHCHVCNIKNGQLIIATDNAHWITRLKFQLPDLLSALRKQPGFEYLSGIDCKVSPKLAKEIIKDKPTNKPHFLSKVGSKALKSVKAMLRLQKN